MGAFRPAAREGDRLTALNLDQVATFLAVARAPNVRAAAQALGLSQGAGTVMAECRAGVLAAIPLEGKRPRKELYVVCRDSLPSESPPSGWRCVEPSD